jgi:hypothetical protein
MFDLYAQAEAARILQRAANADAATEREALDSPNEPAGRGSQRKTCAADERRAALQAEPGR